MAIYHLSVKAISRSTGRSVVAAAAYRSGVALTDDRQGIAHDYTRKQGVAAAFVVAPDGAEWALERHQVEQRVDYRSFERQGKEQEPTRHMGVSATAMERQAAREIGD